MGKIKPIISIQSNELNRKEINQIMTQDETFEVADIYDESSTRGFQDIEWLMFVMMAVPAMDSLISIVNAIRAEISQRVSTYMEKQNIKKTTTLTVQIKIPGFSYEKIQEIVVDPNECK